MVANSVSHQLKPWYIGWYLHGESRQKFVGGVVRPSTVCPMFKGPWRLQVLGVRNPQVSHHRTQPQWNDWIPQRKYQQMVSTMVSNWCETDFAHPQYACLFERPPLFAVLSGNQTEQKRQTRIAPCTVWENVRGVHHTFGVSGLGEKPAVIQAA